MDSDTNYDVAVIGGGPAGLMAAGRAAELGAKVVLIEKNAKLGKKLLITGGGRCNITNAEYDVKRLVAKFGRKGKALFGSFARFGVADTFDFFESRGLKLKIEAEKRAFPVTDKAEDVWKVLIEYIRQGKVKVMYSSPVAGLIQKQGLVSAVKIGSAEISAKNFIVTTGGKSRPETGSTGDGFVWMKKLGHTVEEADSALVPIKVKEDWVKKLSGLSFSDVKLTVFQDKKKQDSHIGKLLFTHFGISGPLVLNMSRNVAELHKYGPVDLFLDLFPKLDASALDKQVVDELAKALNKQIKNNLSGLIPPRMISAILGITGINPNTEGNALLRADRLKIVKLLKELPITVAGFLGSDKAIVTSGGVALEEVDFKTMQSKLISNLYLAGDILNFDRPSGGYSLQICWTTGFLAGESGTINHGPIPNI